ncbi:MAG: hypothetical protein WA825_18270 [Steroidobacteraceae bacterium]
MTRFPGFILLASALVLVACATSLPTPEQYGFRREAINGKDYFCAPPQWVIPPASPAMFVPGADLSGDIPSGIFGTSYPKTHEICLTPAQWPDWVTLRHQLDRQWPMTPDTPWAATSH